MRLGGVPEMVGGQVALGLGGDQFAGDGMDLVQLVEDGDLDTGDARQRRRCGGARRSRGCLGWGRGAGTRFETVMPAVAAGPRLPAASTARTDEFDRRSGGRASGRAGASRPARPARRRAGSARAADARPSSVTKNPSVPAGPASRGVTHETRASPAGRSAVAGLDPQAARGRRRLAIVRPELDREIRGARPVLLAAVDEPIGEEPEA